MMDDCKPLPAPVKPRIPLPREDVERPWTVKQDTLAGFQSLPTELQNRILSLACTLLPYRIYPETDFSSSAVDVSTTLSIVLVSRYCYRLAIELLYRRIDIKHPSALQELQRTLSTRPNLGRLIKALHVGSSRELPASWWPIRPCSIRSVKLTTVLLGGQGDMKRPEWCAPRHDFEVPYTPSDFDERYSWHKARMEGISNAIEAAAKALNIDLLRPNKDQDALTLESVSTPQLWRRSDL